MSCTTVILDGWGSCKKLMPKVNGAIITKKGTTFTDAQMNTIDTFESAIAGLTIASRTAKYLPIYNFENTTDEPTINTTPLGKKYKDSDPIPSGVIYLDCGFNDYKAFLDFAGSEFDIMLTTQDGLLMHTVKSNGSNKGFRATLQATPGLPKEDKSQSYPVYLFFDNVYEFKYAVLADYGYSNSDLNDLSPVGLDTKIVTAYTGGKVIVKVTKRGTGEGLTGLTAADFLVAESNATPTVAVTLLADSGLGVYELTIKKDNDGTPANLAASDWVILQPQDDNGTTATYLGRAFKVVGGA